MNSQAQPGIVIASYQQAFINQLIRNTSWESLLISMDRLSHLRHEVGKIIGDTLRDEIENSLSHLGPQKEFSKEQLSALCDKSGNIIDDAVRNIIEDTLFNAQVMIGHYFTTQTEANLSDVESKENLQTKMDLERKHFVDHMLREKEYFSWYRDVLLTIYDKKKQIRDYVLNSLKKELANTYCFEGGSISIDIDFNLIKVEFEKKESLLHVLEVVAELFKLENLNIMVNAYIEDFIGSAPCIGMDYYKNRPFVFELNLEESTTIHLLRAFIKKDNSFTSGNPDSLLHLYNEIIKNPSAFFINMATDRINYLPSPPKSEEDLNRSVKIPLSTYGSIVERLANSNIPNKVKAYIPINASIFYLVDNKSNFFTSVDYLLPNWKEIGIEGFYKLSKKSLPEIMQDIQIKKNVLALEGINLNEEEMYASLLFLAIEKEKSELNPDDLKILIKFENDINDAREKILSLSPEFSYDLFLNKKSYASFFCNQNNQHTYLFISLNELFDKFQEKFPFIARLVRKNTKFKLNEDLKNKLKDNKIFYDLYVLYQIKWIRESIDDNKILLPNNLAIAFIDDKLGFGVFAKERIEKDSILISCSGLIYRENSEFYFKYEVSEGSLHAYAFYSEQAEANGKYKIISTLDAAYAGNLGRMINHGFLSMKQIENFFASLFKMKEEKRPKYLIIGDEIFSFPENMQEVKALFKKYPPKLANAEFIEKRTSGSFSLSIKAVNPIEAAEEILVNYSNSYWEKFASQKGIAPSFFPLKRLEANEKMDETISSKSTVKF